MSTESPEPSLISSEQQSASDSLREATEELHRRVETGIAWDRSFSSLSAYAQFLEGMRTVFAGAEKTCLKLLELPEELRNSMRTSAWIEEDLAFVRKQMGMSMLAAAPSTEPVFPEFVEMTAPAEACGTLYVLEGSSMGAQLLSGWAEERLGLTMAQGARFLSAYGKQTAARWREIRAWLNESLRNSTEKELACRGACATFDVVERVLITEPG